MAGSPWFHGRISRAAAEFLLSSGVDGSYLVRESESNRGEHTLSLRCGGKAYHYRIVHAAEGFGITRSNVRPTLAALIQHHHDGAHGRPRRGRAVSGWRGAVFFFYYVFVFPPMPMPRSRP